MLDFDSKTVRTFTIARSEYPDGTKIGSWGNCPYCGVQLTEKINRAMVDPNEGEKYFSHGLTCCAKCAKAGSKDMKYVVCNINGWLAYIALGIENPWIVRERREAQLLAQKAVKCPKVQRRLKKLATDEPHAMEYVNRLLTEKVK